MFDVFDAVVTAWMDGCCFLHSGRLSKIVSLWLSY